jgi:endonuclease G, mitochondrial
MPRKPKKQSREKQVKGSPTSKQENLLRDYVRSEGVKYLNDPNINSVGIGYKVKKGRRTNQLSVQFTVDQKLDRLELESVSSAAIPETVKWRGVEIPTDVIQRKFYPSFRIVKPEAKSDRKRRLTTLVAGISVSHPKGTAGTLGLIVYDKQTGQPCMLSNWHVLNTPEGKLGDFVVQPGPFDDNRVDQNHAGRLLRSHLGVAGDCAIARIEDRDFDSTILELGVKVDQLARPQLEDRVIKSGRTTDVTYGVVRRTDTVTKVDYEGDVGIQRIGGFEIGPDPDRPAADSQISMGGDSGSAWLIESKGKAAHIMVGLHFAGESQGDPDDHAMACYAHSVFEKLEIDLVPPPVVHEIVIDDVQPVGYVPTFVKDGVDLLPPGLSQNQKTDVVKLKGSNLIPYTHFSLSLSKSHRMPYFVAWNIDGAQLKAFGRKGLKFDFDPRIDEQFQIGDDVYSDNKLDRGHVARRADLVWGPAAEAKQGNHDSFFFTNITPQHQAFNQSQRHGLWGLLENAVLEDVTVDRLRLSVMAGPIFQSDDPSFRGIRIPRDFWKLVAFVDSDDANKLKIKAYVLTQKNLLDDLEALELDPFRLFQVSLGKLGQLTKLNFNQLNKFDAFAPEVSAPEMLRPELELVVAKGAREVHSRADLL